MAQMHATLFVLVIGGFKFKFQN